MTVDHFQPRSAGGSDDVENLVYACIVCNDHKGDHWNPESVARILHPSRDQIMEHLRETGDGLLMALTDTGRFHIDRLRLNRPQLVEQRRRNRAMEALRRRLTELEAENAALRQQIDTTEE